MASRSAASSYNGDPMKPAYSPDNTRTSIYVISALAAVVVLIAALVGLSDKPPVDAILISANDAGVGDAVPVANDDADDGQADAMAETDSDPAVDGTGDTSEAMSDETPADQPASNQAQSGETQSDGTGQDEQDPAPEATREVILVPTAEPAPTPEIVAAVEQPAPEDAPAGTDSAGEVQEAPSLPTTSGSVQGSFFTKSDENEGAVVSQNLIQVSFSEDGSGAFQGVLDITYADGTHILLNMSGPLVWLPTNPQVEATLEGAFTLDALIDTDDIMTNDAELSISSLSAGSGSLCTTRCFGFTFPPQ